MTKKDVRPHANCLRLWKSTHHGDDGHTQTHLFGQDPPTPPRTSQAVFGRMRLTLHATCRIPHGASR